MESLLGESIKYAYKNCLPIFTTLEITQHCNLKCKHCYNYDRSGPMPEELRTNTLSKKRVLEIIEELADAGGLNLNFSGGEALLHPDILDFIRKAKNVNLMPRLKSNGILLSTKKLEELYEAGLNSMDISLYGFTEDVYEAFTGKTDVCSIVYENLRNIDKERFNINVSIILHRGNVHELEQMVAFAQEQELDFQFSTEVTERYDKSPGSREHEITDEQFKQLLEGKFGDHFLQNNSDKSKQCSCARSVCGISSTGALYPCIGAPIYAGNLKEDSFQKIWQQSPVLNRIRNLKDEDFKSCQSCDYIETCARSSGSIFINTGEYTGCDERTFAQAKIVSDKRRESNKE